MLDTSINPVSKKIRQFLKEPVFILVFIAIFLFVGVLILYPLFMMLGTSLSETGRTLFTDYLSKGVYQTIIGNTIQLGLAVAFSGTLLGFLFAFVQVKLDVPFKRFMHIVALLPIISPPFAVATSVLLLFGRNGVISKGVFDVRANIYGLGGLTFVITLSLFTVAYLNLKGMLEAINPSLEEAATNLGASRWYTLRTVTLPLLLPGLLGSFLLLFVEALADLGNPLVLGGNFEVLATRIYISVIGLYDTTAAAVFSVILLLPSLSIYLIQRYWVSRKSYITVTGKPAGQPHLIRHNGVRWTLFTIIMAICLLIVLIYATIFVGAFTQVFGVNNTFTLDHFDFVLNGIGLEAMTDTTSFALIATPLAGLLGMIIAFLIVRKAYWGSSALDFSTMLGLAVPGTIVGIGFLLTFNVPTTFNIGETVLTLIPKLTGSRAILGGGLAIIFVYMIRSMPAVLRIGTSALSQIDPAIEEASVSLGANAVQTFMKITLPLIRPAFLAGLIYAFARSMTTISPIIFLTTPRTRIMTQQILNETEQGRFGNAFAYCVILIGIVLVAIGLMYFLLGSARTAEQALEGAS